MSAEDLLKKCTELAERAEAAARETETSVSFAAQLGGLDLPSLSDVPAAIELDPQDIKPSPELEQHDLHEEETPELHEEETAEQHEGEAGEAEARTQGAGAAKDPDSVSEENVDWLGKLLREAKETGIENDQDPPKPPPERTQRGGSPGSKASAPDGASETSVEPTPDWKDDWGF